MSEHVEHSHIDCLEIARQGALGLTQLMRFDGSFRYRFDSQTDKDRSGYNALRHAGAIWSILDVYSETKDQRLFDCGRRGITYLLNTFLYFFRDYKNTCICEDNKIKLGGNALSSLALTSLYGVSGEQQLLNYARQLCSFMLNERDASGGLIHKRYFKSGRISDFHSMYYTGEALLALMALARQAEEKDWTQAALEILHDIGPRYGVTEQSHWMLYALELLYNSRETEEIYEHASNIAKDILDNPKYLQWNRSTPIACRTEGMLAFLRMQAPDKNDNSELRERCWAQIKNNLQEQLNYRLDDGLFIRGGKDRRHYEVRIDYTQHNISSYLHYFRLTNESKR